MTQYQEITAEGDERIVNSRVIMNTTERRVETIIENDSQDDRETLDTREGCEDKPAEEGEDILMQSVSSQHTIVATSSPSLDGKTCTGGELQLKSLTATYDDATSSQWRLALVGYDDIIPYHGNQTV